MPTQLRPPRIGQAFTFEIELNRDGKKRAANVGLEKVRVGRSRRHEARAPWSLTSAAAIPAFLAVYLTVASTHRVSPWFAAAYVALSIVCFLAYAFDKAAARAGGWRSTEHSLLMLGLIGGWPGGLLAQQLLRHKSSKASFKGTFWATVLINALAFVGYHLARTD